MKKYLKVIGFSVIVIFISCHRVALLDPPLLSTPAEGAEVGAAPTFTWEAVEDAAGYMIELDDALDFASPLVREEVTTTTFTSSTQLQEGIYYWHVATQNEENEYGDFSDARSFTVAISTGTPVLISPANGEEVNQTPSLIWGAVDDAAGYRVEVSESDDFSTTVVSDVVLDTTYNILTALDEGTYYWHVAAKDEEDNYGLYSTSRNFIVLGGIAPPVLVSPVNGAEVTVVPDLVWNEAEGAIGYMIELDDDADFSSPLASAERTDTVYTIATSLDSGTFYWHVASKDSDFNFGAYSATWQFTLITLDLPCVVGSCEFPVSYSPHKCMASGTEVYVTCKEAGLAVIDVSDPARPMEANILETDNEAWDVFVEGKRVYLSDRAGGISIIDITSPFDMKLLEVFGSDLDCRGIFVSEGFLYATGYYQSKSAFVIYDLTNVNPVYADTNMSGTPVEVCVANNRAYVAGGTSESLLWVYDVSNPAAASLIGEYSSDRGGAGTHVDVAGNIAYLSTRTKGLELLDVSNSANITRLGFYYPADPVYEAKVVGNTAYIADGWGGLKIVDVSYPAAPVELDAVVTEDMSLLGLDVSGNYAYLPDNGNKAFHVVQLE
ncbi:hypothetical protein JXM67_01395 [candidate division WOR-3 bacterium]|nr:hypothetical protein [candidate division WOR-3 bacterium]